MTPADLTRRLATAVAFAMLLACSAASASAQDRKTDVVVLANGDRMTGEIKSLERGRLSLDMASTGVVSIKWDRVVELSTTHIYQVETASGELLLGTFTTSAPGMLVVTSEAGAGRTLTLSSIVGLQPIRKSFFSRLDGSIDLGGSYTQSSGVAQLWINFWTKARRPTFEWRVAFDDYVTFKTEGATSEQLTTSFGYSRFLSGHWAVFGLAQLERNPDLGFDLRSSLIGGVEWTILRSNRSELVAGAGMGAAEERPVEGEPESQIPALLGFRYSLFIHDYPKTTLETNFTSYPILNQWGRWRLKADGTIKREIFRDFTVAFTAYESFDSRPSGADTKRNDVGTTVSIGYTF